jgi:hypothetical protein
MCSQIFSIRSPKSCGSERRCAQPCTIMIASKAMPITAPRSLTDHETYALTAYILSIDGIVKKDAVLDAKSLPKVKMPNRDGFKPADR